MNPLAELRDIHLPQAIGWWPLAAGWYVLGLLVLILIVGAIAWGYHYWRINRPRREVLQQLEMLKQQYAREEDRVAIAVELSTLLRRATLAMYPRSEVASLRNEAWLHFLDDTGNTKQFTEGPGRAMVDAPYQPEPDYSVNELFNVITQWVNIAMRRVRR